VKVRVLPLTDRVPVGRSAPFNVADAVFNPVWASLAVTEMVTVVLSPVPSTIDEGVIVGAEMDGAVVSAFVIFSVRDWVEVLDAASETDNVTE
jgi:hypothetical protein